VLSVFVLSVELGESSEPDPCCFSSSLSLSVADVSSVEPVRVSEGPLFVRLLSVDEDFSDRFDFDFRDRPMLDVFEVFVEVFERWRRALDFFGVFRS